MRLLPSDPDVQTIIARIGSGALDLQPSFQRGEVWTAAKKRKLIDSILRDWHVPPVHVIETADGLEEVLDGQQRLAAIRDFVHGKLSVDGTTPPADVEIQALDGLKYSELPERWRRRFDRFAIRFFRLVDFRPEEPAELFFRLNQPTSLTSAEQRNAFYGATRDQVRSLVAHMTSSGLGEATIGFSNSRMAYDDTLARVCYAIQRGGLRHRITAREIVDQYRSDEGFSDATIERVAGAIERFGRSVSLLDSPELPLRLNKATLFSWLIFAVESTEPRAASVTAEHVLAPYASWFESVRRHYGVSSSPNPSPYIEAFNDRATARVLDVSSVLVRDLVLWVGFVDWCTENAVPLSAGHPRVAVLLQSLRTVSLSSSPPDDSIELFIETVNWGQSL